MTKCHFAPRPTVQTSPSQAPAPEVNNPCPWSGSPGGFKQPERHFRQNVSQIFKPCPGTQTSLWEFLPRKPSGRGSGCRGTLPSNTRKLETTQVPNAKGTPRRVPCAPPRPGDPLRPTHLHQETSVTDVDEAQPGLPDPLIFVLPSVFEFACIENA